MGARNALVWVRLCLLWFVRERDAVWRKMYVLVRLLCANEKWLM